MALIRKKIVSNLNNNDFNYGKNDPEHEKVNSRTDLNHP